MKPNGFKLDDTQFYGGVSPSGFTTDGDKDMDSTDYSQEKDNLYASRENSLVTEKSKKKKHLEINGMIIDDYLASDNLNECVDFLLRKDKGENRKNINKIIRHNSSAKSKEKKKRQRKNLDQHEILLAYFQKNPNWDK